MSTDPEDKSDPVVHGKPALRSEMPESPKIRSPQIVDITQGSLISKLVRYSPVYLVSSLIIAFTAFLLLPINTRLFSEADYGAVSTIDAASDFVIVLVSLNLIVAYARYFHEYKLEPEKLRRYTSTIYWFILGWGILAVIGATFASKSFLPAEIPAWPVLALAYSATILIQLGLLGGAYFQQNHRPGWQVSLNLINFITHALVMVILVGGFGLGLTGKYLAVLAGGAFSALLSTWMLYREGLLRFQFSPSMLGESLIFAIPLLPIAASGWITGLSDRIILALYGTLAETGIYNVGYLLGRGITVFSEAVFLVYAPMIFAMLKKDKLTALKRIERFVPYFLMFMVWMYLALALFAGEITTLVVPARYASAVSVVPVVLFAYLLGSQYKTFGFLLSYQKKTLIISSGGILQAVVNLGANIVLIPRYGKIAAAWTTVAAVAVYLIWIIVWSQKNLRLNLDVRRLLLILTIAGAGGCVALWMSASPLLHNSLSLSIAGKAILLLGVLALFWATSCILPTDKKRLLSFLRKS